MLPRAAFVVLVALVASPVFCQDTKQTERELRQQYEAKILQLTYEPRLGDFEFELAKEERKTTDAGTQLHLHVDEVKLKKNEVELRARRVVAYIDREGKRKFAAGRPGVYRLRWPGRADMQAVRATLNQLLIAVPSLDSAWLDGMASADSQKNNRPAQWYDDSLTASAQRIGGDITPPVCIICPQPEYPEELRRARVKGVVVLYTVINQAGRPHAIRVSRSVNPQLDAVAAFTVGRWKFKPAFQDGRPITVYFTIEIDFHLY